MAATAELGLGVPTGTPCRSWNKWVETVDPHRQFISLDSRNRFKGKIHSQDFQERLDKIATLLQGSPESPGVALFCIDQWAAICKQNPKNRAITEETIEEVQSLLITSNSAWFLSAIKIEFVVLWALLNQGEFRQHTTGIKIDKIALLKKHFSRHRLDQVARSFFDEGFYYVALQFYRAIREKENAPFVNSQIGRCLHLLGYPGKALEYFEKVDIHPDDLTTFPANEGFFLHLINLGDAYFDLHYSEKALEKYSEVLKKLQAYEKTFRNVQGKEDQKKRIQALVALAALLKIRTLDEESERKECFLDFELDAFWRDAEDLHEWADRFPTTELRYRFFTAYMECGSFLDHLVGGAFMEYDDPKTKKLFPFKEAHPAAIRPLSYFFTDFYPEQSERLLILIPNFFVSHSAVAKIHKIRGLIEVADPIVQQAHYKEALSAAKYHMNAQRRENVIDQTDAFYKLGNMYAFLGRENKSLEKTVKAWDCYKRALDLAPGVSGIMDSFQSGKGVRGSSLASTNLSDTLQDPHWPQSNAIDEILALNVQNVEKITSRGENLESTLLPSNTGSLTRHLAPSKSLWIKHIQARLSKIQDQSEEFAKSGAVDPSYRLARKLAKMERYPEAALYFMRALKDFTPQEDDSEDHRIYNDTRGWLKASLKRISPPHHQGTLKTLDQLKKLLIEFRDDDLIQLFQEAL